MLDFENKGKKERCLVFFLFSFLLCTIAMLRSELPLPLLEDNISGKNRNICVASD